MPPGPGEILYSVSGTDPDKSPHKVPEHLQQFKLWDCDMTKRRKDYKPASCEAVCRIHRSDPHSCTRTPPALALQATSHLDKSFNKVVLGILLKYCFY
jgi:hypothetical protein